MNISEIEDAFGEAFDQALLFHGFTDYMRDYQLVIQFSADARTGIPTECFRYIFTSCVSAQATTAVKPQT